MYSNLSIVIFICAIQYACSIAQPADLGTFGSHNDLQNGIASYSLPPENRIPNDIFVLAFINYTYINADGQEVNFSEEKAKYGEGRIKNVIGKVVHITNYEDLNDHTACSDRIRGTNGHDLPPIGVPWIALIKRGNCPFDDKVKHVYEYRAAGVVVYNDRNETTLNKMKINDQTRDIAAVLTFKYIGEDMAKIVDGGQELMASISEGRYARPLPNMNKTSVLFVSISFIVLMIISFVWLVFYYVQRFRYLQTKDRKSRQLCTVAKRVIAKIPTKSIKSEDNNDIDNDCCAICIEPYKITDIIRVLPCRHEFHKSCIDPWLLEHRTCPMCKMDILKHYGFVVGAQNQIINFNNFVITSSSPNLNSNANRSPHQQQQQQQSSPPPPPPPVPPPSHQQIPSSSQIITTESSQPVSFLSTSTSSSSSTLSVVPTTNTSTTSSSSITTPSINNLNNINNNKHNNNNIDNQIHSITNNNNNTIHPNNSSTNNINTNNNDYSSSNSSSSSLRNAQDNVNNASSINNFNSLRNDHTSNSCTDFSTSSS